MHFRELFNKYYRDKFPKVLAVLFTSHPSERKSYTGPDLNDYYSEYHTDDDADQRKQYSHKTVPTL